MRKQFPAIKPYDTYRLEVDNGHNLYVEECGDPKGIPVIFIHGGPGGGIRAVSYTHLTLPTNREV